MSAPEISCSVVRTAIISMAQAPLSASPASCPALASRNAGSGRPAPRPDLHLLLRPDRRPAWRRRQRRGRGALADGAVERLLDQAAPAQESAAALVQHGEFADGVGPASGP